MAQTPDAKAIRRSFAKMRRGLGLSVMALAKSAGLSNDKLARWEKGLADFTAEEIGKLGAALDSAAIARTEAISGPVMNLDSKVLKSMRLALGLTQEELARRTGLSRVSISFAENGYAPFTLEEKNRVEKILNSMIEAKYSGEKRLMPLRSLAGGGTIPSKQLEETRSDLVKQPLDEEARFKQGTLKTWRSASMTFQF